jgi:hypothetical protein
LEGDVVAEGDKVVARWKGVATHKVPSAASLHRQVGHVDGDQHFRIAEARWRRNRRRMP